MTNSFWCRLRRPLLGITGSILIGVIPLLITLLAVFIAWLNGCKLDEGSPHPCEVCGVEMGMTLYAMGLMAWFCALTIPVGLLLLAINAVWAVKEIMCWVIASEKQQTAAIISTKKFTDKEVEKFMAALKSAPPPVLVPDPPALTAAEREAIVEGLFAIERQLDGPLRGDLGGYARDQRQAAATLRGLLERLK